MSSRPTEQDVKKFRNIVNKAIAREEVPQDIKEDILNSLIMICEIFQDYLRKEQTCRAELKEIIKKVKLLWSYPRKNFTNWQDQALTSKVPPQSIGFYSTYAWGGSGISYDIRFIEVALEEDSIDFSVIFPFVKSVAIEIDYLRNELAIESKFTWKQVAKRNEKKRYFEKDKIDSQLRTLAETVSEKLYRLAAKPNVKLYEEISPTMIEIEKKVDFSQIQQLLNERKIKNMSSLGQIGLCLIAWKKIQLIFKHSLDLCEDLQQVIFLTAARSAQWAHAQSCDENGINLE